jgi:signal transduction histidine kinase
MRAQRARTQLIGSSRASSLSGSHGRLLTVARAAWIVVTVIAVGLFVAGLPGLYEDYRTLSIYPGERDIARENLAQLGISLDLYAAYLLSLVVILAVVWCTFAVLLFWRKSDDRMALFVALMFVLFGTTFASDIKGSELPILPSVGDWFINLLEFLALASLLVFFYLFPNGRFVPRWTRWLAVLFVTSLVLFSFLPSWISRLDQWPLSVYVLFYGCWFFTALFAQVYRYKWVSTPVERQQAKWVIFSFAAAFVVNLGVVAVKLIFPSLHSGTLLHTISNTVVWLLFLLAPLSIGIAILRYRLWDIDVIINRTLVYGALSASVVGLYALLVGGLGSLLPVSGNFVTSLVAAGLVAVLFTPLRARLQRGVNHLMYGERDEPYTVLSRLGRRLETTLAPEAGLEAVAEAVAQALKLPYAAIELKRDDGYKRVAERGDPKDENTVLPLVHQGETVGRLVVAPRSPGEEFSKQDRSLLEDLAWQAGAAAHAARLTTDLRRSRERLVTTREEERRRLRRDLHDGLGPTLGGITLGLDAARSTLAENPTTTDALLADLKAQTQEAVSDVRRLVHGLRPPALDDLGLVSAIRQQASKHGHLAGDAAVGTQGPGPTNGLTFTVEAPEDLVLLPAAVEVVCYRMAQEAITNVSRHARARSCSIRLSVDEMRNELVLEIADDGVGMPEGRSAGVGMSSMRERAEELGGTLTIESPGPEGGTRVLARLPLPEEER